MREIAPILSPPHGSAYAEMDAAASIASSRPIGGGRPPFVYIVSLGGKHAFQAAGSVEFDSGGRARVFKDAKAINAPGSTPPTSGVAARW